LDAKEFANFFNTQQRDPRLNDILFPRVNAEQAMVTMEKYGGDTGNGGWTDNGGFILV
jgi:phosphatidylinositol phospholipase C beta